MFEEVNRKLERAEYFLNNLKTLASTAGGFAHIKEQQEMRANLDGFFFEVVSAKDFFLQGINEKYRLGLTKRAATDIGQLKQRCLDANILSVLTSIKLELDKKNTWLWKLNNYRNSATHRELLHLGHEAELPSGTVKTYLFEDPEDPSQGNAKTEVIPYCDQSLTNMRDFLGKLYSKLPSTIPKHKKTGGNRQSVANWLAIGAFILLLIMFCIIWIPAFGRLLDGSAKLLRTGYFLQSLTTFVGILIAVYSVSKKRINTQSHPLGKLIKWVEKHDMIPYILFWTLLFFLLGLFAQVGASFLIQ